MLRYPYSIYSIFYLLKGNYTPLRANKVASKEVSLNGAPWEAGLEPGFRWVE